jgi:hypothetical protein
MSRTHLVIPDSHAHPDFNNDRFEWLGKLIVDLQPDVVVNLGDRADMASLCSYDKGTKGFEGRRYNLDIEANKDANARLFGVIDEYNKQQRQNKKRQYRPETYFCMGNHEHRINRAIEEDAILDGTISLRDLGNEDYYDVVADFLSPVVVDGVTYQHYFTSGVMNRSIAGEHPAYSCLVKKHVSCISGHSHMRDFAEQVRGDGKRIMSLVAGVYQDYHADYAGPANEMWWSGVVILRNVEDGEFEHEWVSIKTLKEKYGS